MLSIYWLSVGIIFFQNYFGYEEQKRWVCERKPEIVYFKWSEFQLVSSVRLYGSSLFWHRWCRKWGWFLALLSVVIFLKRVEGKGWVGLGGGGLLRQVVGVWGRCDLRADTSAGGRQSRRTGWGWAGCLSKKNTWRGKDTSNTEMKVRTQRDPEYHRCFQTWTPEKCPEQL